MKNPLKIEDSLIISRLEQKELSYIKPSMKENSQFYLLMGKVSLKPFINNLPIKIGLDLQLMGDKIIQSKIDTGYFSQNIERDLGDKIPALAVLSLERIEPKRPIFYQIALMLAFDELLGLFPNQATLQRYQIALEFARISHHLDIIKNVFACLGTKHLPLVKLLENPLSLPIKFSRKVEKVISNSGLSWTLVTEALNDASLVLEDLNALVLEDKELSEALKRKATLNLALSASLGLSGLFTRANRNNYDLRKNSRFYQSISIPTSEGGDAWARFHLRILDIQSSIKWLKQTILSIEQENSELNAISIHDNFGTSEPVEKFSVGEISGPEGDIRVSIFTSQKQEEKPLFFIRSPAFYIAHAIPEMIMGLKIHELPIILHSLGIRAEEVDK